MKYISFGILVFHLILGLASVASAQGNSIPNPGFEVWDSINSMDGLNDSVFEPVNWTMFDGSFQSTDAHSGYYALGGVADSNNLIGGGGGAEDYFHLSFTPTSFEGYYKLVSVQNDFVDFEVWIRNHGNLIGTAEVFDSITSTGWVHFSVPISYTANDEADSAEVYLFGLGSFPDTGSKFAPPHAGSAFVIDDLSLPSPSGVNTMTNNSEPFVTNYPNPAIESTNLTYDVPEIGMVTIELFDQLGKKLLSSEVFCSKGLQTLPIDVSLLPSGAYCYRVSSNGHSSFGKVDVIR